MSDTEKKFYSKMVNQSFFYRGHPAGFVVALTSYFGLQKLYPSSPYHTKLIVCLGTSLAASLIARDSYMETIQRRVVNELPPSSYLRRSVEQGLIFHSTLFHNLAMPMNETLSNKDAK